MFRSHLVPRISLFELCPLLFLHFALFMLSRTVPLHCFSDPFALLLIYCCSLCSLLFQSLRRFPLTTTACPCGEQNTIPDFPVILGILFLAHNVVIVCNLRVQYLRCTDVFVSRPMLVHVASRIRFPIFRTLLGVFFFLLARNVVLVCDSRVQYLRCMAAI